MQSLPHRVTNALPTGRAGTITTTGKQRAKKWAPRARTGCKTCRTRRIKCDETKPSCQRCQSSGRTCDGYGLLHTAASGPGAGAGPRFPGLALIRQPVEAIAPQGITPSQRESYTFALLQRETITSIAGSFDQEFWTTDAMRAASVYPAVWHASLAVTALHRRSLVIADTPAARADKEEYYVFALTQYNASIRHLIAIARKAAAKGKRPSVADQESLLLTNLMFLAICCSQGDMDQVISHSRNCLRLYYDWRFWEVKRGRLLTPRSLVVWMNNVEARFIQQLEYEMPKRREESPPPLPASVPFSSVTDCFFEHQALSTRFLLLTRPLGTNESTVAPPAACSDSFDVFRDDFYVWKSKFEDLERSDQVYKPSDIRSLSLLKIMTIGLDICLQIDDLQAPLAFDAFLPEFTLIVDLSEQLYHQLREERRKYTTRGFAFSMSACECLSFAVNSCRDAALRKRALNLLDLWPKWDVLWDPKITSALCRAVVTYEEEPGLLRCMAAADPLAPSTERDIGCPCLYGEFICELHRVCVSTMHSLNNKNAVRMTLKTWDDCSRDAPGREVAVTW